MESSLANIYTQNNMLIKTYPGCGFKRRLPLKSKSTQKLRKAPETKENELLSFYIKEKAGIKTRTGYKSPSEEMYGWV